MLLCNSYMKSAFDKNNNRHNGYCAENRKQKCGSVDEMFDAAKTGALEEAWCIGTAAVISPIGALGWGDKCYEINHNRIGELSQKLYDELTGIQWGTKPDPFGWTCPVC